ncbi:MAG: hypothetical protein WBL23_13265 [Salinisphaera sp.]|uniref:hypothetical protein n=1 Tax=Salinisphaera sp. TaxID=1914330 RepID=UPI003C7D2BEF
MFAGLARFRLQQRLGRILCSSGPGAHALCGVILVLIVAAAGVSHASDNWDTVGYVASMYAAEGHRGDDLRDETYADIKKSVDAHSYQNIIGTNDYQTEVYRDAEALRQQLPFYSIRIAYIETARLFVSLGTTHTGALRYTAIFYGGLCVLMILAILAATGLPATLCIPVSITAGLLPLVQLNTPDVVAAAASLAVLYLLIQNRHLWGLAFVVALPFIRTDFVLLSIIVACYVGIVNRKIVLPLASAAASVAVLEWIDISHGNYGYLTILNFTFFHLTPYPADMAISPNPGDYVRLYLRATAEFITLPIFYIYVIGSIAALVLRKINESFLRLSNTYLIGVVFLIAHFMLFPAYFPRYFFFVKVMDFLVLAALCASGVRILWPETRPGHARVAG